MVAYHHMANNILVQPFATKHDRHHLTAADTIMAHLQQQHLLVHTIILDNKASADYCRNITNKWHCCTYQLVPPDMHCRNSTECVIRTFKAHFIAILTDMDTAFPANRWDLLLSQVELMVNLLLQSQVQPTMSACWEHL